MMERLKGSAIKLCRFRQYSTIRKHHRDRRIIFTCLKEFVKAMEDAKDDKKNVKKVLVIGSDSIVIGQAAEFDYAGTQACRSLKEEGMEVILVNSNPSTIMTDVDIADRVYIEPITLPFVTEVIKKERPDALLATLGGQVGLNMAVDLSEAGVLEKYGVELLGSSLHAIKHAEDRELFKRDE